MTKVLTTSSNIGVYEEVDVITASSNWYASEYRLSENHTITSGTFIHSPVPFETNGYCLDIENTGILAVEYMPSHKLILEAPEDGKTYARQNGEWVDVTLLNPWTTEYYTGNSTTVWSKIVMAGQTITFLLTGYFIDDTITYAFSGTASKIQIFTSTYSSTGFYTTSPNTGLLEVRGTFVATTSGTFTITTNLATSIDPGAIIQFRITG